MSQNLRFWPTKGAQNTIFHTRLNTDERNISRDSCEILTWWRHFTACDVILLYIPILWRHRQKCWHQPNFSCSYPIKDIFSKYQTEFGQKPIHNRENIMGGPNSPPPRPTQPPNNPPEVGLMKSNSSQNIFRSTHFYNIHRPGNKDSRSFHQYTLFSASYFKILFKILIIEPVKSEFQLVNNRWPAIISSLALHTFFL